MANVTEYNLNNYESAKPFLKFKEERRTFQGQTKVAYKLQIIPDGKEKPQNFSTILHGCKLSRVFKDKWGSEMMFASWDEDAPELEAVKKWSEWIIDYYKEKIFSERSKCIEMGYSGKDGKDPNKTIRSFLTYDETRKVWSMILRPIMSDGVSSSGVKFNATKVIHRPTKKTIPITDCLQREGKGVISRLGIELKGNQGDKRFSVNVYELLYNNIKDASGDYSGISLSAADALDPINDEVDEDELALLDTRVEVEQGPAVLAGNESEGESDQEPEEAPAPEVPVVSAIKPTTGKAPLKALKK
jgi:hypothetical protein